MNTISFMTANYVARQLDYTMTGGWGQGDTATQNHFRPIETYRERLEEIFKDIQAMGFTAIDLWGAHLHPRWATDGHIATARELLQQYGFKVASLAAWWDTVEDLEASCRIATVLNIPVLGGGGTLVEKDYDGLVRLLRQYGLKYGFENHPEKTPEEILAKIKNAPEVGATVDTGWFGTQGYDAAVALEKLGDRVFHIHLKNVRNAGTHETCRYDEGVVPIERCVKVLKQAGYQGAFSIEHEPETFDPTEDVRANLKMLREWLV